MKNNSFFIAENGFSPIAIVFALFILSTLMDIFLLEFITFAALLAMLWMFRNPERVAPHFNDGAISSVADGEVIAIDNVDSCKYFDEPCLKIVIKKRVKDIALLRAPFDSQVSKIEKIVGAHLSLKSEKARSLNDKTTVTFEKNSKKIVAEHIVEYGFQTISVETIENKEIRQSSRYAFMNCGESTMYLPNSSRVSIKVGDELSAGESLVGYFTT
ncbi:MAG: hypothetical protein GQ570_08945 [Helicobacteraceae bacterium]|nr:hypothetical protein [Helicobacteraceae bacterium]